jgi:hypothetical protein
LLLTLFVNLCFDGRRCDHQTGAPSSAPLPAE